MPKKGYKQTIEHIEKRKEHLIGQKNPNWKGGVQSLDKTQYHTDWMRRWRKNNPEKSRFLSMQSKLKRKTNIVGSYTYKEWRELKERWHNMCPACLRSEPEVKLSVDHIVPISKGGTNFIWNIQPLCISCNSRKYTKDIEYKKDITPIL